MSVLVVWYVQLIMYLISFSISLSILYTIDWKKIITPRFRNDNWPLILYIFFAIICGFLLGSFTIQLIEMGMTITA